MATPDSPDRPTFESERQRLQETVDRFTDAVTIWRQWKEDYETLQEDVKLLPADATREDRAATRKDYEGDMIDDKELIDIFGKDDSRKPEQILSVLTNRLDYVAKNIETLNRKVEDAQEKLFAHENPDVSAENEDDLPMTEIFEQLDDDDNVISYSLRTPGKSQKQLIDALEKAGLKGADTPTTEVVAHSSQGVEDTSSDTISNTLRNRKIEEVAPEAPVSKAAPTKTQTEPIETETEKARSKKGVSFSEDTKPEAKPTRPTQPKSIEEILQEAAEQQVSIEDPVIPADDSPEDADLREDMLAYNRETMLYEMAPIVAELNLEQGSDFDTDDDWDEDEDEDDEEDRWGRSTKSVVTDDWKRQMLELKERLSNHTFGTSDTSAAADDGDKMDEQVQGIGRISIRRPDSSNERSAFEQDAPVEDASTAKKGVRFAPKLDIADEKKLAATRPKPVAEPSIPQEPQEPLVDPLSDIVERKAPATTTKAQNPTKKPSRFKKSLADNTQQIPNVPISANGAPIAPEVPVDMTKYAPSGPEGQTLADTILEREPSNKVVEPDEFDANLLHQQATEEYYKMRNTMIQRQGGFNKEDTSAVRPLDEEEGGPKKVSRFRAARLNKA